MVGTFRFDKFPEPAPKILVVNPEPARCKTSVATAAGEHGEAN
jgi:glycosyltransferase A (GT-A) superfamily protein (DUF2064 family)